MSMNAKLFVGQIPRSLKEDELLPLFEPYGSIVELSVIRDKFSLESKGCVFLTYTTQSEAEACIQALHNQHTFPGLHHPMQVKFAESGTGSGDVNHLKYTENQNKLFIGMIPRNYTETELQPLFLEFGEIAEVVVLRGQDGQSKGCAFLTFKDVLSAIKAIAALDKKIQLSGASGHLVVKFASADKKNQQQSSSANSIPNTSANFLSPYASLFSPQLMDAYGQLASTAYMLPGVGGFGLSAFNPQISSPVGSTKEGPPGANLFIFHIPNDWTDVTLYTTFSPYGNVLSCKIQTDRTTGLSRGFGFVSYDNPESAQLAIASANGFLLVGGKRLKVEIKGGARSRTPY